MELIYGAGLAKRAVQYERPKDVFLSYKLKGSIHTIKKLTGYRTLYFKYLYMMGVLPKDKPRPPRHPTLWYDVRQLRKYTEQIRLLTRNKIDTSEQLQTFADTTQNRMDELIRQRTQIQNKLRRAKEPDIIASLKAEKTALTEHIAPLRRDLRAAVEIEERSARMKEKLAIIREVEEKAIQQSKQRGGRVHARCVVHCADCGSKLHFRTCKSFTSNQDNYVCAQYKSGMGQCSAHFIREEVLRNVVLEHIQRVLRYIQQFESGFVRMKYEQSFEDRRRALAEMKREIVKANRRIDELDMLFKRIYEDHVIGKLSDERFQAMSGGYDSEQRQLKADVARMEADVAKGEEITANFQAFLANVRKYTDVTELTPTVLNDLVHKVFVEAPDKSSGKRKQHIHVSYDLLGILPRLEDQANERATPGVA